MPLTDLTCLHAKPQEKIYRLSDGNGLFLEVSPKGHKYWRHRYFFHGKEKMLALGVYPKTSLLNARASRDTAQKQVAQGINPVFAQQEAKRLAQYQNAQTFELVVREWHQHNYDTWTEKTAFIILRRFEIYIFPDIGRYPIGSITDNIFLACLQKVENKSADIAKRLLKYSRKIFNYARRTGRPNTNPTDGLEDVLKKYKRGNHASIDINHIPQLLEAIRENKHRALRVTILAMRLLMLTAVRTNELVNAKKTEFRMEIAQWIIPAKRMKMENDHIVPLSKQAIQIITEIMSLSGNSDYLLPSKRTRKGTMSDCTILRTLERMGYKGEMTGHGFRTLFMGVSKEKLNYAHDVVDRQLAHVPKGTNGKAYDRASLLPQRTKLMQDFADYIDNQTQERNTYATNTTYSKQQFYTYSFTQNQSGTNTNYNELGQASFIPPCEKGIVSQTPQG